MALDPNHEFQAACKRRREIVLGNLAATYPNWLRFHSHSTKINANLLLKAGKVERVRDTYSQCWYYRWIQPS